MPSAWLSLDKSDNDPARYLAYLITSLQSILPELGKAILKDLQSPQPDFSEGTLVAMINEISASSPPEFVLILDDYHLITAPAVQAITNFLLAHMPAGMHLVMATRADPDLPLPRLRGRGEMIEIRQEDLQFTPAEASAFFSRVRGLTLSPDDIEALVKRTEGWIAGLQMALLSMAGKSDIGGFIREFTGSDRYILDYLMDEVFRGQSEEVQDFLIKTALVDRLTAPLCNALTGSQESQAILEGLERDHVFIINLDNERNWYRYHHLFADLLQKRLTDHRPELIPFLHRRAGNWYKQHGYLEDAIEHTLAARDYDTAIVLVARIAEDILMQSELKRFLNWLQAIPDKMIRQNAVLGTYYAYALTLYGYPIETIESYCGHLESAPENARGYVAAMGSLLAMIKGDIPTAGNMTRLALKHLPVDDRFMRTMAFWVQSAIDMLRGNFEGGFQRLEEVVRQSKSAGNVMGVTMAACNQAKLLMYGGELRKARELYQQVLSSAKNREGGHLPIAGEAFLGMGELFYEWNQLDQALAQVEQGLMLTKNWGTIGCVEGLILKARILRAKGEMMLAYQILEEAHEVAMDSDATLLDAYQVAAHLAELRLAQGDLPASIRWAIDRELGTIARDGDLIITETLSALDQVLAGELLNIPNRQSVDFYTLVYILMAKGQYQDTKALLSRLLAYARQRAWTGREILVQTLMALVEQKSGNQRAAMEAVESAVLLAERDGYIGVFLDRGARMQALLEQARRQNTAPKYVSRLLLAFEQRSSEPQPAAQVLVDPLSKREMDVLRLLPSKLTAVEIADRLYVAESTVRTHIKHIYTKLNVNRRIEAVERARELGLL
jgi:LuxR family maltose regulon positive regulatory protein